MKREIVTDLVDFKEIIEKGILYVDKTDFIEELLNTGSYVVSIARPRRFGKTLNMSMLSYFFDINKEKENRKLFEGLKIEKSKCFAEQGQYPVINMTFKSLKSRNWEDCYSGIVSLIKREYRKHRYLKESNKLDEEDKEVYEQILKGKGDIGEYGFSLLNLSEFLHKHYGKKVVVLVDEFDTPVIEGELKGYFGEVSDFMEILLGELLKNNENLRKGVVTGITRLQGAGIFSGVNSARNCTIFNAAYRDKFGFTEKEVKGLLKEYNMEEEESSVREHYNGYNFRGEVIYNPFSVLSYIDTGELANFWLSSSNNDLAKKKVEALLEMKDGETQRKKVENLLQGEKVKVEVNESLKISEKMNFKEILNLLLYSGYLKYENYGKNRVNLEFAEVSIPNLEIKAIYKKTINSWLEEKHTEGEIEELKKFLKSVCEGCEGEIKKRLENYLNRRSIFDEEKVLEMG